MKLSELKKTQWFRWFISLSAMILVALFLYIMITFFTTYVVIFIVIVCIVGVAWVFKSEYLDKLW